MRTIGYWGARAAVLWALITGTHAIVGGATTKGAIVLIVTGLITVMIEHGAMRQRKRMSTVAGAPVRSPSEFTWLLSVRGATPIVVLVGCVVGYGWADTAERVMLLCAIIGLCAYIARSRDRHIAEGGEIWTEERWSGAAGHQRTLYIDAQAKDDGEWSRLAAHHDERSIEVLIARLTHRDGWKNARETTIEDADPGWEVGLHQDGASIGLEAASSNSAVHLAGNNAMSVLHRLRDEGTATIEWVCEDGSIEPMRFECGTTRGGNRLRAFMRTARALGVEGIEPSTPEAPEGERRSEQEG